jgi:hypothetical protein
MFRNILIHGKLQLHYFMAVLLVQTQQQPNLQINQIYKQFSYCISFNMINNNIISNICYYTGYDMKDINRDKCEPLCNTKKKQLECQSLSKKQVKKVKPEHYLHEHGI